MFKLENAGQQNNTTSKSIWLWLFWCFWFYHQELNEFDGCFLFFFSSFLSPLRIFTQLSFSAGSKFISNLQQAKHFHLKFTCCGTMKAYKTFCFVVFMFRGQPEVLFNSAVQHTHWCLTLYHNSNKYLIRIRSRQTEAKVVVMCGLRWSYQSGIKDSAANTAPGIVVYIILSKVKATLSLSHSSECCILPERAEFISTVIKTWSTQVKAPQAEWRHVSD